MPVYALGEHAGEVKETVELERGTCTIYIFSCWMFVKI